MGRMCARRAVLAAVVLVGVAGPTRGDDWPQWRGPRRDGVWREEGILTSFPEGGLQPVWSVAVAGGYAGPAVADGRVFVLDWTRDEGSRTLGGRERLQCLDETSGELLWTREWPASYSRLMGSYATGPRATPTVDGDRVYVLGAVGDLLAFDVGSGELLWQHDFVDEYDASIPIWGTSGAPLVDGDLLVVVAGAEPSGKVLAYDKRTGEEQWRAISSDWEMGYEQLIVIEAGGARQLIVWEPRGVFSLDPASGREHWHEPWEVGQGMTVATPVFEGGRLLLSQFYYGSLLLELDSERPAARRAWAGTARSELPDRTVGLHSLITTPVLTGDTIFGVCSYGQLRGLDAATGERLWVESRMTRQGRWGAAFMVAHGDRWFVNNDQGELIIARFTRGGYEEIDRTPLLAPTSQAGFGPRRLFDAKVNWSHPAYANRHIVARNDREVIRVSLAAP